MYTEANKTGGSKYEAKTNKGTTINCEFFEQQIGTWHERDTENHEEENRKWAEGAFGNASIGDNSKNCKWYKNGPDGRKGVEEDRNSKIEVIENARNKRINGKDSDITIARKISSGKVD